MLRAIHRLIEGHVTTNGDAVAVVEGDRSCSSRELNAAANSLARRLMTSGFRRGMCADVRMTPSVDLAVILLAILKAGGYYTWRRADARLFQIPTVNEDSSLLVKDIQVNGLCGGPNLPVVTRETDIACVIDRAVGEESVAVPHATIIAMAPGTGCNRWSWVGEPGAFDLWAALICGATAVVARPRAITA